MDVFRPSEFLSHVHESVVMVVSECKEHGWMDQDCLDASENLLRFIDTERKFQETLERFEAPSPDHYPNLDPAVKKERIDHDECFVGCGCTLSPQDIPPEESLSQKDPLFSDTELQPAVCLLPIKIEKEKTMLERLAEKAKKRLGN